MAHDPLDFPNVPPVPKGKPPSSPFKPDSMEKWFLRTPDGQTFGPVPRSQLGQWRCENRITPQCQLRLEGQANWKPACEVFPTFGPSPTTGGVHPGSGFCRNCGGSVRVNQVACLQCGVAPLNGNKFCPGCRAETHPQAIVCIKCGIALNSGGTIFGGGGGKRIQPTGKTLEPVLACLLSLVIVGLGQMLLGQTIKGVVMLIAAMVLGVLTVGLAIVVVWPVSAIDAYMIAKKLREGKSVGEWEFF